MISRPTYIAAIGKGFPGVQAYAPGDGSVYEEIILCSNSELPMPSKSDLDTWILNETKNQMWELIKQERDRRKGGGVLVDGKWFHSDDASRVQFLGLKDIARDMLSGGANNDTRITTDGSDILWKTMSGDFVYMTVGLAIAVVSATGVLDARSFKRAEFHRYLMCLTSMPENYDCTTGWPDIYG